MTKFNGFKIVLTGDESLVSTYHHTYLGFASGLPMDVFPSILGNFIFPTLSDERGRMKTSQYGLCKIEAALLDNGFSRNDVAIVDPRKLDRAIGSETRVLGISVLDPLGINYGTALLRVALSLMGVETRLQSYMSWATMKIFNSDVVKRYRSRIKVVVGGQGVWEIVDSGLQQRLGIDCIVEGEGELIAPRIFRMVLDGMKIPRYVKGSPVPVDKIPVIRTPSRGIVEVTRGCGRGCLFCNPTLLMFRTIPIEKVVREVMVNVAGGERNITLHSEDFLRYGSTSLLPNEEKVVELLSRVMKAPGVDDVSIDFVTASTALVNPRLVKIISDMLGLSDRNMSIIQMGIESASPRIIKMIAPGKPKPFSYEEWPRIVEDAVALLNECGWWICATIIINLPQETVEDIEMNIKLLERLEHYNVFIFPLPFIPSGSLRKSKDMMKTHKDLNTRNLELIALSIYDAIKKIKSLSKHLVAKAPIGVKQFLGALLYVASAIGLKRIQRFALDNIATYFPRSATH
ncbi:radical SAM protein [Ignisphaera sp. 4213-co]|uniref:Radical SAM protein n=1 Tax=Ignisphaera cupida TaxID=3050454 RepID=A0ABD4Z5T8_9CREN|nr:radical SAM protein [Ignisphaera sp. 4213-co]MDK6028535.1 radical SAM protein [Ignisphaera sp. 4213-co]